MARQADQKMRYNDAELSLMKNTFADNDDLLFAVRKLLLGDVLLPNEKKILKDSVNEPIYQLLEKTFLPHVDSDAPLFQLTDLVMTLSADMRTLGVEAMAPLFMAKQMEIDYLTQQFELLKDVENKSFSSGLTLKGMASLVDKDAETTFIEVTARNYLLSYIDSNIQQIKFLAGKKEESVEETLERLQKNSAK